MKLLLILLIAAPSAAVALLTVHICQDAHANKVVTALVATAAWYMSARVVAAGLARTVRR